MVKGIEPVAALRKKGYEKGLTPDELMDGDAYQMPFADNSFDLVCEFAVLHHVRHPNRVVQEMSRIASQMICISDCNFMGQGTFPVRLLKWFIFSLHLWPVADFIKTRGKGYTISEGDGLAYSYSVYQSLPTVHQRWQTLRLTPLSGCYTLWGTRLSAAQLLVLGQDKVV